MTTDAPLDITTQLIDTPAGQRLGVIIPAGPKVTVNILLTADDAKRWGAHLTSQAAGMSAAGLVVAANGSVTP